MTLATPATFIALIVAAASGETVQLAPGPYPYAYFRGPSARTTPVTIDATDPAAISAGMRFDGGVGITIKGITLQDQGLSFINGSNITVVGFSCNGAPRACVALGGVSHATVTDGNVTAAGSDGIDVANSDHVEVARIRCSDGAPTVGAHPDCVQAYANDPAHPLSYVSVHDNYATGPTQGFTVFGTTVPADHVSFVNNHAKVTYPRGISMTFAYGCTACAFIGNTVEKMSGARFIVQIDPKVAIGDMVVSGNSGNSARP